MGNDIILIENGKEEKVESIPGLNVEWLGENAQIKVYSACSFKGCKFQVNSNSSIEIGEKSNINGLYIRCAATNSFVKIGRNFAISSGEFILAMGGSHQSITIGDNCLFSSHVAIFTSDGHSIIDAKGGEILNNIGGNIYIGEHCWVGYHSILIKSARLASNTIVGANSLITKAFSEEFCCVAGQPAKIIKKNVKWSIKHPSLYKGI